MIYQTKQYMQFQAWHDGAEIITAGGMPLLLRDGLAYTPNNSYGGPTQDFCPFDFINDLKAAGAKEYLIRFTPWLRNHIDFPNAVFSRHTVARDLSMPIRWGHGTKSSIKKNMESDCDDRIFHGYELLYEFPDDRNPFFNFHRLYIETMERNQTERCYKYNLIYFSRMFAHLKDSIDLFTIMDCDEKIIAAATFLHDKYTAHYQFSGMDIEYAHLYPMERLISEACHYYQGRGVKLVHFGGGLAEDDSLHRFKKKFGNLELEYYTARGSV
jgi:hypothetical protein